MDGSVQVTSGALREPTAYWSKFIARCIAERLDTDRFEEFVPLVYSQHRLAPIFIADLFLKPQPSNNVSLDPRIPPYIKVLSRLGYVDAPSILWTMYKYSSLHAQLRLSQSGDDKDEARTRCWRISSWAEEVMFYHVIKTVVEGSAFRDSRAALVLVRSMCKWMDLFTSASTAFAADVLGEIQSSQVRDEMDVARAAFIPLLLRLVETPSLVKVISKPVARGAVAIQTYEPLAFRC